MDAVQLGRGAEEREPAGGLQRTQEVAVEVGQQIAGRGPEPHRRELPAEAEVQPGGEAQLVVGEVRGHDGRDRRRRSRGRGATGCRHARGHGDGGDTASAVIATKSAAGSAALARQREGEAPGEARARSAAAGARR